MCQKCTLHRYDKELQVFRKIKSNRRAQCTLFVHSLYTFFHHVDLTILRQPSQPIRPISEKSQKLF